MKQKCKKFFRELQNFTDRKDADPFRQKIDRINANKWTKISTGLCLLGLCLIGLGTWLDLHILRSEQGMSYFPRILQVLSKKADTWYSLLATFDSISAAALIFFYSVMDNRKEGIPHRRVMAFVYGSYSGPFFFILTLLLLPAGYLAGISNFLYSSCFMWIYVMVLQIGIITEVLNSTSYKFCQKKIREMERSQFLAALDYKGEWKQGWFEVNSCFNYYIEIVLSSNELFSDKIELVREILKIPIQVSAERDIECSRLYHFYYENLAAAFHLLKDRSLAVFYDLLYELADCWIKERGDSNDLHDLYAVITAFWNAALVNASEGVESFCVGLLNRMKSGDQNIWISLYFLSLEYAFRRDEGRAQRQQVRRISNFYNWKFNPLQEEKICCLFWKIWTEDIALDEMSWMLYLKDALDTLSGQSLASVPISDILSDQRKEEENF